AAAFALILALAGAPATSRAQQSAAEPETTLRFAETATVSVQPDELVASVRAETIAPTPAEAQRRVNAAIADALSRIKAVPGLAASTGAYSVWRIGPTPQDRSERWQASQSVTVKGKDGAALLDLIGTLQQKGLAVGSLAWQLAPETAKTARQEAMRKALGALRARAE